MMPREVAWRMFADELNGAIPLPTGSEEYSPNYVLTPLGAKVNRVLIVGVLTDVVNVGSEEEPLWRARVTDPTGVFYITAGQYQPEAAQTISRLPIPSFVAVVGKTRVYSPGEGINYISIRPESIKPVEREFRDIWVVETAASTLRRIEATKEANEMDSPSAENIAAIGFPQKLASGVMSALEQHGGTDASRYVRMVSDALAFVEPEIEPIVAPGTAPGTGKAGGNPEEEQVVLGIIKELAVDGGVLYDDVIAKAKEAGIERVSVEESVNSLMDDGAIYEPFLGKLSIVDE